MRRTKRAQARVRAKPAANPTPDVLVLSNGDTLHGKFVNSLQGKITFHSDPLGDITVTWDKVKELHATEQFSVLDKNIKLHGRKSTGSIPAGTLDMTNQAITVQPASGKRPDACPDSCKGRGEHSGRGDAAKATQS